MSWNEKLSKFRVKAERRIGSGFKQNKPGMIRKLQKLTVLVLWYVRHPGYFIYPELFFSNIELSVTTNCTLCCKKCAHYTPRFEREPFLSPEIMLDDLNRLLESVKWIDEFRVLGGEPLLYPDLCRVVSYLLDSKKIGMVEIVTNGTLSPKKELLSLFPNNRLNIYVSNYGKLSKKIDDFASNPHINVTIPEQDYIWFDHGDLTYCHRSEDELKRQYAKCDKDKFVFYEGRLFNCACSAFGARLGAFSNLKEEYVDFRNSDDKKSIRQQIRAMKRREYFTACSYCLWGTDGFVPIPVAEQTKRNFLFLSEK